MTAVQTDGTAARLAHGESDLVEHRLVDAGPACHGGCHEAGRPDVFGLSAEAEFNGWHAIPLGRTGVHLRGPGVAPGTPALQAPPEPTKPAADPMGSTTCP
ncbi:hypothetical protein GCM10010392_28810 [Streptomyces clavifer]|nr:hypothetical protein GCM10010392_28810 [Streptomyces clavifer]